MPPRRRGKQTAPEAVEELPDDFDTPEVVKDDVKTPPSKRKGSNGEATLAVVPDAVTDVEEITDVEDNGAPSRTETILDLVHRELGVILDERSLDMCLRVADFYRSAVRTLDLPEEAIEDDETEELDIDSEEDENEDDLDLEDDEEDMLSDDDESDDELEDL